MRRYVAGFPSRQEPWDTRCASIKSHQGPIVLDTQAPGDSAFVYACSTTQAAKDLSRDMNGAPLMADALKTLAAMGNLTGKQQQEIDRVLREAGYGPGGNCD